MSASHDEIETCVGELLRRGRLDWIDLSEAAWVVTSSGFEASVTLQVVAEVVLGGLMKAGDLTEGGFVEWELGAEEAVKRIVAEWNALGRLPEQSEICWLSNTSEGDQRAS